jgi:hypothetical protein
MSAELGLVTRSFAHLGNLRLHLLSFSIGMLHVHLVVSIVGKFSIPPFILYGQDAADDEQHGTTHRITYANDDPWNMVAGVEQ